MADEWIKMRHRLPRETEVKTIAARLGVSRQHVCGCLLLAWSVADQHAIGRPVPGGCEACPPVCPDASGTTEGTNVPLREGFLSCYTGRDIDHEADQAGFAEAMADIGWLTIYPDGVAFPQWDVHHSSTAKSRASEAKKKGKQRSKKPSAVDNVPQNVPLTAGQTGGPEGEGEGDTKKKIKNQKGEEARAIGGAGRGSGERKPVDRPTPSSGEKNEGEKLVWEVLKAWDEIGGVSHEHATIGECGVEYDRRVVELVRSRLRDPEFAANWERGLRYVRSSDLCCGRVAARDGFQAPWRAGLKWFCSPGKLAEVLAGKHGGSHEGITPEDEEDVFEEIRRQAEQMEQEGVAP